MQDSRRAPSSVAFLLGAGASVDAGLPTVTDLIKRFETFLDGRSRPRVRRAYDLLTEVLSSEFEPLKEGSVLLDVELLLETIQLLRSRSTSPLGAFVDRWRANVRDLEDVLPDLEQQLRVHIREQCTVSPASVGYLWPLKDFVQSYGSLDIFTLNYDASIEIACQQREIRFTDGFDSFWNPEQFDSSRYQLRLFKMHGSLHWYHTEGPQSSLVKIPVRFNEQQDLRYFTDQQVSEVLIYPAFSKEQHVEPYASLMSRFRQSLESSEVVVAIGCSFRDAYLKQVLLERMTQRPELKLIVVDPNAGQVLAASDRMVGGAWQFQSVVERVVILELPASSALAERRLLDLVRRIRSASGLRDEYLSSVWSGSGNVRQLGEQLIEEYMDAQDFSALASALAGSTPEISRLAVRMLSGDDNPGKVGRNLILAAMLAKFAPLESEQIRASLWLTRMISLGFQHVVWRQDQSFVTIPGPIRQSNSTESFFAEHEGRLETYLDAVSPWLPKAKFYDAAWGESLENLHLDLTMARDYFRSGRTGPTTYFDPFPDRNRFPRSTNEDIMRQLSSRFQRGLNYPLSLVPLVSRRSLDEFNLQ